MDADHRAAKTDNLQNNAEKRANGGVIDGNGWCDSENELKCGVSAVQRCGCDGLFDVGGETQTLCVTFRICD